MKTISLIESKYHTLLTAYVSSDNFGTQHIEYVMELDNGQRLYSYSYNDEGSHIHSKKQFIEDFDRVIIRHFHGDKYWPFWMSLDELLKFNKLEADLIAPIRKVN